LCELILEGVSPEWSEEILEDEEITLEGLRDWHLVDEMGGKEIPLCLTFIEAGFRGFDTEQGIQCIFPVQLELMADPGKL